MLTHHRLLPVALFCDERVGVAGLDPGQGIAVMAFYTTADTPVGKPVSLKLLHFSQEILDYLTGRIGYDTINL